MRITARKRVTAHTTPRQRESSIFTSAREVQNLDQPQSLWNRLAFRTRQQDPFCCSSTWQLSFHDAFSPKRRLLIRHSDDSLVAFAEKVLSSNNIYLTPIEPLWFFGNNVLGPHGLDLLTETLVDIKNYYAPVFPKIMISAIPPQGVVYNELRKRFSKDFALYRHSTDIQCAASLAGGLDGFQSRRSANHRRKLKKQVTRADAQGVTFERHIPASSTEVGDIYARMIAVELASWKGAGRCGMAEPRPKRFYDTMLRRLAASQGARVIFARHKDKDIGFIFGGMAEHAYRGQQFSYDDGWSGASIGNILQFEQIKWLCEEGAKRYDLGPLLGDRMDYKQHWAERKFHIETWMLERK